MAGVFPSQDALVTITDSVFPGQLRLAPGEAIDLIRRYPSRFTLSSADPRPWPATLALFKGLPENTLIPIVTGSRGGNAALASLLMGLAKLGLVVDATTV